MTSHTRRQIWQRCQYRQIATSVLAVAFLWLPINGSLAQDAGPGQILVNDKAFTSLAEALRAAEDEATIVIGKGVYAQAGVLTANYVRITGLGSVVLKGRVAEGKAALVLRGNRTTIENIECHSITVPDGNGACIRLEGQGLTLRSVYFHDSQQGLLTGNKPGLVVIENSRFENLGWGGQAHGIYMGRHGRLLISKSSFLSSKGEGHEIKSRAEATFIEDSVVASQDGYDSRLIDLPHGGKFVLSHSILEQGPNSVNWDMIGFGLEGSPHAENEIIIDNNLIIMERPNGNNLLNLRDTKITPEIKNNVIVGKGTKNFGGSNIEVATRKDAGLPLHPALPELADN